MVALAAASLHAMPMVAALAMVALAAAALPGMAPAPDSCLGEYQLCPASGMCTLFSCNASESGVPDCQRGEYRCPLSHDCVEAAAFLGGGYSKCPGVAGSHLDHTLPVEQRLDKLVQAANLSEQISQLTNSAPALERLGIPGYQWLNDDVHGVDSSGTTTSFPDGPGLGASWDKALLRAAGHAMGMEARAVHNNQTGSRRPVPVNGMGLTLYGPNMNLVRDPRWGRNQEVYSEDVRLSSALTVAFVAGIQQQQQQQQQQNHGAGSVPGPGSGSGFGSGAGSSAAAILQAGACCKHLVAYDVETNRMSSNAVILAIGETVILLHPPLPLVGVSIVMERERQQNDSLADG